MNCTRCGGTGFLNHEQFPAKIFEQGWDIMLDYMNAHPETDIGICDCCGNGDDWYGTPGEHFVCDYYDGFYVNGKLPNCY